MTIRNLDALFKPASIAVFGATDEAGTVGAMVVKNLLEGEFEGKVMLVAPKRGRVCGTETYADLNKLPEVPTMAVITARAASVPRLVARLGKAGTRGVVIINSDPKESAAWRSAKLQQQLLDAAQPHLVRILGPGTVGVMLPRLGINASFSHVGPRPGKLALLTQSGAIVSSVLDWAQSKDMGFSNVVTLGSMCDIDFGDMLNYLSMDMNTDAILIYMEGVTNTRKFMSAARAAARAKPVIVLKAGRFAAGAKAAASHTGALVGSDAVYDAVFRRTGMLRVYSVEEVFDAAQTLSKLRQPKSNRLAVITNGGALGVLAADSLAERGGQLAELSEETCEALDDLLPEIWSGGNPVDLVGDADGQRYAATIETVAKDDEVDALLVINYPTAITSATETACAVIDCMASMPKLPLFTSWVGSGSAKEARAHFSANKIPTYLTPEQAIRAFMHVVDYYRGRELLMQTPASIPQQFTPDIPAARALIEDALAEERNWLSEPESKRLLEAYGIPVVTTRTALTVEEAGTFADELGSQVVLKIISPDVSHKSDVSGVALDLFGGAMVTEAAMAMTERLLAANPDATVMGYSVQPMVRRPNAYELIIGMMSDPQFGPIIMFGQGGTGVEVVNDKALGLPPLNMRLARELISHTRIYKLLAGFRDRPAVDIDAIALSLIKVGQMITDHPEIIELDINPLICDGNGVMALDARVMLEPTEMAASERLAIKPYPKELEKPIFLDDGTALLTRPIMPEDEPSLHESFTHLTPREIYQRFFTPLKSMSHSMAARFTQLDYDRDMALVLTEPGIAGKTPIYGVVRLAADPDRERAEFAIIVGNIMTGKGLGKVMMLQIIDYARQTGIKVITGDVLHDNTAMLGLCKSLGFSQAPSRNDESIVNVSLEV